MPKTIDACMEADQFAMSLLMPTKMVYEQCTKLAEADIPRSEWHIWIGKLFGVPKDKAHIRLKQLRI